MYETTANASLEAFHSPRVENHEFDRVIGESPAMREAKVRLAEVAKSGCATVLLRGETGTGRDLCARVVHYNSPRREAPFVSISCASLPERLLDAELFGRSPGVGAGASGILELADRGTVFLDEVAAMSLPLQARLLRFLDEGMVRGPAGTPRSVEVRIIAATSVDLAQATREGRFEAALFERLGVLPVDLPRLQDRHGDVRLLMSHFIGQFNREFRKSVRGASPEAVALLESHRWPGNVRELKNRIEQAVLLSSQGILGVDDFPGLAPAKSEDVFELPARGVDLRELERRLVIQALERTQGNRTRAARLLGLNRDQMRYRVAKFGLKERRFYGSTPRVTH